MQSGLTDTLTIGVGELDPKDKLVKENLKKTKELLPGLDIVIQNKDMASLVNMVLRDKVDLVIISKHMVPMIANTELQWKTIIRSHLSIYVHKSNPLYERDRLEFADLKQEKFIAFSEENDDSYIKLLHHLGKEAGFVPQISCYIPSESSFKINLELGNGVVLADSYTGIEDEDIKRFDLEYRNDIVAIWNPVNCRQGMKVFLSLFDDIKD